MNQRLKIPKIRGIKETEFLSKEEIDMKFVQYGRKTAGIFGGMMEKTVKAYEDRYPTLFRLARKEAKDDVRFVFCAAK